MSRRSVPLMMDNCSAHFPVDDLPPVSNIKVHYLPPNKTSKLQLCDAVIIRNLKAYYRRQYNQKLIDAIEAGVSEPETINTLQRIQLVVEAWTYDVKPQTMANCFA